MKKNFLILIAGFSLVASLVLATGCFTSPTAPPVLGVAGHGGSTGGDPGDMPEPTPVPVVTNHSISGTITGASSSTIAIMAMNEAHTVYRGLNVSGTAGAYTIANVPNGTYTLTATDYGNFRTFNYPALIVVNNADAGNINISF